jgi:hypothetical protein
VALSFNGVPAPSFCCPTPKNQHHPALSQTAGGCDRLELGKHGPRCGESQIKLSQLGCIFRPEFVRQLLPLILFSSSRFLSRWNADEHIACSGWVIPRGRADLETNKEGKGQIGGNIPDKRRGTGGGRQDGEELEIVSTLRREGLAQAPLRHGHSTLATSVRDMWLEGLITTSTATRDSIQYYTPSNLVVAAAASAAAAIHCNVPRCPE